MSNVEQLAAQLTGIFGPRLKMVAAFGAGPQTCAVVDTLTVDDLDRCAALSAAWKRAGMDVPLLIVHHELARALDAFPLEFSEIIATRRLIAGNDLFQQLAVTAEDVRRACEVQARSHLLHLREGYLETRGRGDALSVLIVSSAPAFAALVASLARLDGQPAHDAAASGRHGERLLGVPGGSIGDIVALTHVREISSQDAERLFPPYLDAVEKLVSYVDNWRGDGR